MAFSLSGITSALGLSGGGKATVIIDGASFPVQFNPESYSFTKSATVSGDGNNVQFTGVKREDFSIELLFDSYETGKDVREAPGFQKLIGLINPEDKKVLGSTPKMFTFVWGPKGTEKEGFLYKGFVVNIKQNFTLFKKDGTPLRCKMAVTVRNFIDAKQAKKEKGKHDSRMVRTIKQGERLDLLAHRTLHNPYLWRELVNENPELITNPRRYPLEEDIGKSIIIPDYYNVLGDKNG